MPAWSAWPRGSRSTRGSRNFHVQASGIFAHRGVGRIDDAAEFEVAVQVSVEHPQVDVRVGRLQPRAELEHGRQLAALGAYLARDVRGRADHLHDRFFDAPLEQHRLARAVDTEGRAAEVLTELLQR